MKEMMNKIKRMFNRVKSRIQYDFGWLSVYNTPFKGIKPNFYFGEISVGTPYFFPRKWKKHTRKSLKNEFENSETITNKPTTWEEYYKENINRERAVPIKYFGINYVSLGWKTKWDDFRFEWNPLLSIVLFGKQLVIGFLPNIDCKADHAYWEAYLYYTYKTNKKEPKRTRFIDCVSNFSTTWFRYKEDGTKEEFDYYHCILKNKYAKMYKEWKTSVN